MRAPAGRWRVALIDSCGEREGSIDAAAFLSDGRTVECRPPLADPTGHGSRIAELLMRDGHVDLLLGQVFLSAGPTSGAAVAAAIDWALAREAGLVHLSLGLAENRAVLEAAVARAVASGCIVVAAAPARGAPVYPGSYPKVLRASGDARCAPGELSHLARWHFGGCPRLESGAGGASVGAAWVTRAIVTECVPSRASEVVAALCARANYVGPETRADRRE